MPIGDKVKKANIVLAQELGKKLRRQRLDVNRRNREAYKTRENKKLRQHMAQRVDQEVEKVLTDTGKNPLTPPEQKALAVIIPNAPEELKRGVASPRIQKSALLVAKAQFVKNAEAYVDTHLLATQAAMAKGEFDVAAKHAEWALEAVGDGKHRVIEAATRLASGTQGGPRVLVGVQIGGMPRPTIDVTPEE